MNLAATLLALAAAAAFAVASTLEQRAAKREKLARALDPRLLMRLLHQPIWLLSLIPEVVGTGLQALALSFGPLALVEPLLLGGVFLAIPMEAALSRRRVHRRDFAAASLGVLGLTAFLLAAQPRAGVPEPTSSAWIGIALVAGPLCAALVVIAWHTRGAARGGVLGVATGLLYALAASLLKTLTARLAADPLSVLTTWHLYALIVVGFAGVVLNQNALQSGRLAAPLTAITTVDPFASILIGVTAFQERLDTSGPRLTIELAAAVAIAGGIWLASTARSDRRQPQPGR